MSIKRNWLGRMFSLDNKFLEDVGLGGMPEEQKKPFLQHIYIQLEKKVGENLSNGMSEEQLSEFEAIIDRRDDVVQAWLQRHAPDYQSREDYQKIAQAMQAPQDDPAVRSEYAATKWLEVNRPDYRDVVAQTLDEIKKEIVANRDAILGVPPQSSDQDTTPPTQATT